MAALADFSVRLRRGRVGIRLAQEGTEPLPMRLVSAALLANSVVAVTASSHVNRGAMPARSPVLIDPEAHGQDAIGTLGAQPLHRREVGRSNDAAEVDVDGPPKAGSRRGLPPATDIDLRHGPSSPSEGRAESLASLGGHEKHLQRAAPLGPASDRIAPVASGVEGLLTQQVPVRLRHLRSQADPSG